MEAYEPCLRGQDGQPDAIAAPKPLSLTGTNECKTRAKRDRPGHDVYFLTEPRRLVPRYASQSVLYEASARHAPGSWLGLPGLSTPSPHRGDHVSMHMPHARRTRKSP